MNILIILLPQYYYYKLLQPIQRDRYCLAKRKILDHPREKMFFVFIFTPDSSFLVKIKLHGKSLTAFLEFCLVANNEMKPLCVFGSIAFKEFSINFNRLWEEVGNLSNISFLILIVLFRHFIKKALNSNILFTQRDKYYFSDAFSVGFPVTWLKRNFRWKVQIIGSRDGLYIVRYSIRSFSRTRRETREIGKQELHKLERSEKTHTLERWVPLKLNLLLLNMILCKR